MPVTALTLRTRQAPPLYHHPTRRSSRRYRTAHPAGPRSTPLPPAVEQSALSAFFVRPSVRLPGCDRLGASIISSISFLYDPEMV